MRLYKLELSNVGAFKEAQIDFITEGDNEKQPPVTIITGENGTGKTTVLDAIRLTFGYQYSHLNSIVDSNNYQKRVIGRELNRDKIARKYGEIMLSTNKADTHGLRILFAYSFNNGGLKHNMYSELPFGVSNNRSKSVLCVDYWTSKLSTDSFDIQNFVVPKHNEYLVNSLSGVHKNTDITNLICYFDYLRSSESPQEKATGEFLYATLKKIFKISLDKGELAYVQRSTFTPIITQGEQEITLDKLSSGNLYLIQRLVSLLSKMYSIHVLNDTPIATMLETEGLLLIDEAENHLHPKWQKTFIQNILSIFPNLQIILTTHSPFIVASYPHTRLYVCKSKGDYAVIEDETASYNNQPIDEILLSPLFGGTYPFNQEITDLLQARKKAIAEGDKANEVAIETQLKKLNPQYFGYLDIDNLLQKLSN